jgi:putative transposase
MNFLILFDDVFIIIILMNFFLFIFIYFLRYAPTYGCGEIGAQDAQRIVRLSLSLDDLISRTSQAPATRRNSMRRAQARIRYHIRNLVDELHRKAALWLVKNFDVIIIPPFNGGEMGRKIRRNIGAKTVRKIVFEEWGRIHY